MEKRGPCGLEFASARVALKVLETMIHLRPEEPRRKKLMIPAHIWSLVEPYGLKPRDGERH